MSQFANIFYDQTPFDLKGLADIIDAAYSKVRDKDEFLTKTGFSPSVLGYGSGKCPRRWVMAFQGAQFINEYDAQSIDNMQAGTDGHERMQKNFEDSDMDVTIEFDLRHEDPPIHGYVDLILNDFQGFKIPIEIKTTRAEAFVFRRLQNKGKDYHVLQLLIYLYVLQLKHGLLLYENKNDHKKLLIEVKMTDENMRKIERVMQWMRKVYKIYEDGDLPEVPYRKNSAVCKSCPLQKWCTEQPEGNVRVETLPFGDDIDD